jgi:hypothetical protein
MTADAHRPRNQEHLGRGMERGNKQVLNLSQSDPAKLASIEPVLRFHQRDTVYEVMVIRVQQAATWLHARAVILISEPALAIVYASELQALVAHEIAHEYVWDKFQEVRKLKANRRLQELELYCDWTCGPHHGSLGPGPRPAADRARQNGAPE